MESGSHSARLWMEEHEEGRPRCKVGIRGRGGDRGGKSVMGKALELLLDTLNCQHLRV